MYIYTTLVYRTTVNSYNSFPERMTDESKVFLGVGAVGLALGSLAGVTPRVGLLRALSLGFKSYFKTTYPSSVRKSEIKQLNEEKKLLGKKWKKDGALVQRRTKILDIMRSLHIIDSDFLNLDYV